MADPVSKVIDDFLVPNIVSGDDGVFIPNINQSDIDPPKQDPPLRKEEEKQDPPKQDPPENLKDKKEETPPATEETNEYKDLNEYQLYAELAKEDGYLPEDFDVKTIGTGQDYYKNLAEKIEEKYKKQYENDFSEENVKLFMSFLNSEYITEKDAVEARRISNYNYLANLEIEEETQEAQKNVDLVLTNYYIGNKIPRESVPALIRDLRVKKLEVQTAAQAQEEFHNLAKTLVDNYVKKNEESEREEIESINKAIQIYPKVKSEKERDILKSMFNDRTELVQYKNHKGEIKTRKDTKANVLLREALKSPDKLVAIISHLNNLNNSDSEPDTKNKKKKEIIFEELTKRSKQDAPVQKSEYPLLEQLKQNNFR